MINKCNHTVNLLVYKNSKPIGVFESNYIGVLGVHVKTRNLNFSKGDNLEIELMKPGKVCFDSPRFPFVTVSCLEDGVSFRHKSFEPMQLDQWLNILNNEVLQAS